MHKRTDRVLPARIRESLFAFCAVLLGLSAMLTELQSASAATVASGTCGDTVTWVLDDEGALTISGSGPMEDYYDERHDEYFDPEWLDYSGQITSVTIAEGVTSVGAGSFYNDYPSAKSLVIADSVKSIGRGAFGGLEALETIIVGSGLYTPDPSSSYVSQYNLDDIFEFNSASLKYFEMNSGLLGSWHSSGSISSVLSGCSIDTFIINGGTLMSFTGGASGTEHPLFHSTTSINNLIIGENAVIYDEYVFRDANIKTVTILPGASGSFVHTGHDTLQSITVHDDTMDTIKVSNCTSLTNVDIKEGMTKIYDGMFSDCTSLSSIKIPSTVQQIGTSAFSDCTDLSDIKLPNSVQQIGASAFSGCSSLAGPFEISGSIQSIGASAFKDSGLTQLNCYMSSGSIGEGAFMGLPNGSKIYALNKDLFVNGVNYDSANTTLYGIFTTTFVNHDGTVLQSGYCNEGEIPSYAGAAPTKAADNTYTYAWTGWDKALNVGIVSDTTYTAQFTPAYINYTITYKRDDGTLIREDANVHYGDTLVPPSNPTKEQTAQYTYTFTGWDKTIAKCTGDATYTANFTPTIRSYTVKFVDWDGTELSSKVYNYGSTVAVPSDPVRGTSEGVIYSFKGWDKTVTIVTGNVTYTAQYDSTGQKYTITFLNWDGSVISTKSDYVWNDTVILPSEPSRPADERNTYYFSGWDYSVAPVTRNMTYTAQYMSIPKTYTVIFKDYDGALISSETYQYGEVVDIPVGLARAEDEKATYVFAGWDKTVAETCTGSATYTAQYAATLKTYTVIFRDYDGTVISSEAYHYGDSVSVPADPERAADNTYTYVFAGWNKEVAAVTGNATYTATYTSVYINYTITFKNDDGTVISSRNDYHFGDSITVPNDPQKAADGTYTYAFAGWDKPITNVAGDTVYTATYTPVFIEYVIEFKNYDGSIVLTGTYHWGDTVEVPAAPSRPADAACTYAFSSWSPDVQAAVRGNAVYTAQYEKTFKEYVITFVDWDGSVISEAIYHYGDRVVKPADPERAADSYYNYAFIGWDYEVSAVSGNATYIAQYSRTARSYTVAFYNWDNTLLYLNTNYHYGDTVYAPAVSGAPVSDNPLAYSYIFSCWSPEFSGTVTGNAIYTAQFAEEYINYTVTFVDWDGTVLSERSDFHYGDAVTAPDVPGREENEACTYSFAGWDMPVTAVEGSVVYTAQYEAIFKEYMVSFLDYDGTVISSAVCHWGDPVVIPASPSREATAETVYSFSGWSPEISAVVAGDAIYTATYAENVAEHTVTFKDWDNSVISSEVYPYGSTIDIPDDPYRIGDDTFVYQFTGWSPEVVSTVSGSALYVAQYEATYIEYTVTFKDYDGSVISSAVYHFGDTVTVPTDPAKEADNTYTYAFAGWDNPVTAVHGNAVYVAQYTPEYKTYTVTFTDHDGTILFSKADYHYGDTVNVPMPPNRESDTCDYVFAGWSPEVSLTVTADAAYTATYTATVKKDEFTVTFVDYDGTVLAETVYQSGEIVEFPADPVRETDSDGGVVYTFASWNMVKDKDSNITFTATYNMSCAESYSNVTVIFEDYDGTELAASTYHQGESVVAPEDPERESDAVYDYTFTGWVYSGGNTIMPYSLRDEGMSFMAIYTANYLAQHREYTVVFKDYNGNEISSAVYHYGDTVAVPEEPTRAGDDTNTYKFAGWDKPVTVVQGDAVYTATYTATPVNSGSSDFPDGYRPGSGSTVKPSLPKEEPETVSFPDVPADAWYAAAVDYAAEKGLVSGLPDGNFYPQQISTRVQLIMILYRLEGTPDVDYSGAFSDVMGNEWYAAAIEWAFQEGIVNGYGDGTFGAYNNITREQLVTILFRYARYKMCVYSSADGRNIASFEDVLEVSSWAYDAMQWACDTGLVQGTGNDKLEPHGNATRAQLAAILMRFCEATAKK